MHIPGWIKELFKAIDACDAENFVNFLTDDATLIFANAKLVKGKADIRNVIATFFTSVAGLSHKILEAWEVSDAVICRGQVNYIRKDKSRLTVPFVNIFKMQGSLIKEYAIYVDISQLYT